MSMGGSSARTGLPQAVASATYNAGNQLTQWGSTSLTYDLNGNFTSDGTNTYTWDARGQLAAISGSTTASFAYDAFGRRTSRTVSGATTGFRYDGANAVQEQAGGSPSANLLTGGVDQVFQRTDSTGTRTLLPDGLGSTLGLMDSAGVIQTQYTYDPFGTTTVSGQANANPTQFTGRENDGTGLYYYRARYYQPALQRFISEDPTGFGGGDVNLYSYVGNNPAGFLDPSGLCRRSWHPGDWGDCAWDAATGAAKGAGTGLLAAVQFQNNATRAGVARLGQWKPGTTGRRWANWMRSFHIDVPAGHFNADFGPLRRLNHMPLPSWMLPLGTNRALRGIGGGLAALGIAADIWHILSAPAGGRAAAICEVAVSWAGAGVGAGVGGVAVPGIGAPIGAAIGGAIGGGLGGLICGSGSAALSGRK